MNRSKWTDPKRERYMAIIEDLIDNQDVQKMKDYVQHGSVTCFEHCMRVSYTGYRICKFLKLDYRAAARGGMLHDFFLYDWRVYQPPQGLHAFSHPGIALENAKLRFNLTDKEEDVISKHMWPITRKMPGCWEAAIVGFSDKYCAAKETARGMAVKALRSTAALCLLICTYAFY